MASSLACQLRAGTQARPTASVNQIQTAVVPPRRRPVLACASPRNIECQASPQQDPVPTPIAATWQQLCRGLQHNVPRRQVLGMLSGVGTLAAGVSVAQAIQLPAPAEAVWEALGGGPPDLVFPEQFEGVWDVMSELVSVETPLGEDAVPNLMALRRAQREDLNRPVRYQVSFIRNDRGKVVFDRRFNTASMLSMYYDGQLDSISQRISWNPNDPNVLSLSMPQGFSVRTRVTRRSEEFPAADRIETSEYVESVYEDGGSGAPRVKASQCFTKYKFRGGSLPAGSPSIVASQRVSDYLTPMDGEAAFLAAANKPYAVYAYRMAFFRQEQ